MNYQQKAVERGGKSEDVNVLLTCLSELIVPLSSWESLSAVVTFAELATISALSSRHFCMSLFSLSWDFFNAR